ncbi:MAG TPA: GAF domain-containing sensor histidine kinase [Streptosporangiaceae bacterium]|nr:GAF domain-containing sensor histidine kinase [Streptosporangiaceae bacterium]
MTPAIRMLVSAAMVAGAGALLAVLAEPVLPREAAMWAANVGWTLGGLVTLCGTFAAGLRRERGSAVRGAWLLWTAAAVCWVAGALYRDLVPLGAVSFPAAILWLVFALLSMASFARRLPRPLIYGIFLLDALPVVLLIVAIVRLVEPTPPARPVIYYLLLNLYPALFGLCAANAIQMTGVHRDLRRIPASVWFFTAGFCLMGLAALVWTPVVLRSGVVQGHLTDGLWTLGLIGIGAAGLFRTFRPAGALVLPTAERESGPHALPPAAAVLGLIILLPVVPPRDRFLLQAFLLASAVTLFVRVYLMRREDVRLLRALVRSQERAETAAMLARRNENRLRLLADITSRLRSLLVDELLQAVCDTARELLGARYAAFGLGGGEGERFARLFTSGMSEAARSQMAALPAVPELLTTLVGPGAPVRISNLREHPVAAALPGLHPPLDNFLGVPVPVDSARGVLCLTGKEGGFEQEDETLAQLLAANAGSAIASAELYAESRAQQDLLTEQNEQLRELDRMKDEFIAVVSHELRTPLTSIIGYLELLDDPDTPGLSDQQRSFTAIMHRNADRLLRLVGDLLFLAGLQTGELAIEHGEADMCELARSAVDTARSSAEAKHIKMTCASGHVPAVPGDAGRLAQLLDNLISNALKFTHEDGQVSVTVGVEGRSVVLTVSDTGIGMSADEQEHIFERFFRAEFATDRAIQGLGLGLTIVKAIVDAHNGGISVHSEPGRGTTFRVLLPLGQAQAGHGGTGMAGAGHSAAQSSHPVTMAEQGPGRR